MNTHSGRLVDPTTHSSSAGCSCMAQSWARKKWSKWFAEAASKEPPGWTPGKMYPLSSWWDTWPPKENKRAIQWGDQLKMLPGPLSFGPEWAQDLAWDILSSVEEHLQQSGVLLCQKEIKNGHPPEPLHPTTKMRSREEDWEDNSYKCRLAEAREAHWQVLVATHMLEERIKRLSQLAIWMRQGNCQCSHSWGHLRRQSWGHRLRCTKTPVGGDCWRDTRGRWTQSPSPSPTKPWKHVTFQGRVVIWRGSFDEAACGAVSWQKRGQGV